MHSLFGIPHGPTHHLTRRLYTVAASTSPSLGQPLRDHRSKVLVPILWLHCRRKESRRKSLSGIFGMTVKKRKSLSGIFGMTVKKSIEKLRPQASRKSLRDESMATLRGPPSSFNSQRLRSLAEEMETADTSSPLIEEPSVPYRSRYGNSAFQDEPIPAIKSSQGESIRDKLQS